MSATATNTVLAQWPWLTEEQANELRTAANSKSFAYTPMRVVMSYLTARAVRYALEKAGIPITPPAAPAPPKQVPPDTERPVLAFFAVRNRWETASCVTVSSCERMWAIPIFGGITFPGEDPIAWQELPPAPGATP
jgi:hypothetical protein